MKKQQPDIDEKYVEDKIEKLIKMCEYYDSYMFERKTIDYKEAKKFINQIIRDIQGKNLRVRRNEIS